MTGTDHARIIPSFLPHQCALQFDLEAARVVII